MITITNDFHLVTFSKWTIRNMTTLSGFHSKFLILLLIFLIWFSARQVLRCQLRHRRHVGPVRPQGRRLQGLVHAQGQGWRLLRVPRRQRVRPCKLSCRTNSVEAGIRTGDRSSQLHQCLFHVHAALPKGKQRQSGEAQSGNLNFEYKILSNLFQWSSFSIKFNSNPLFLFLKWSGLC